MFPQLVAGPIVRSSTLMPQLDKLKPTNETERWNGLKLIALGFFKKVFIFKILLMKIIKIILMVAILYLIQEQISYLNFFSLYF